MRFTLKHGTEFETVTPTELAAALAHKKDRRHTRVRATQVLGLDAAGSGQDEVYGIPIGWEFEVRRVVLDLDTASDPATGNVPLNVAGKSVEYLRSGTRIEYANPLGPNVTPQVPGAQTWGAEQGPYLRNGEVFEVRAKGLTAGSRLSVSVEGILSESETQR